MTKRPKSLIHAVYLALFLMFAPGIALSEDQTAPTVQQSGKTTEEPAAQKSGALITPDQEKQKTEAIPQKPNEAVAPAEKPVEARPMPASAEPTSYVIKKGDTLWDFSNTFLKDPFLWPFIWKANPSITNPDLIYPGNKLAIPSMAPIERALQAPAEPKEQLVEKQAPVTEPVKEQAAKEEPRQGEGIASARATRPKPIQPQPGEEASPGNRLILPEERPVPIIDKYAMLSAGFVNQEEAADKIIGARYESKVNLSYDDVVYVKIRNGEQVKIGDKFLIYAEKNKVKHPKTGQSMGHLIRGLGILQITANNSPDVFTARITLSFDTIVKNNLLTPYQEPNLIYPQAGKKAKDISGFIIEVADERSVNSQLQYVYLDKGSADGVEAGDTFIVYADYEDSNLPKTIIGEVQVFIVKEHTSTAFVRKNTIEIIKGNEVVSKK